MTILLVFFQLGFISYAQSGDGKRVALWEVKQDLNSDGLPDFQGDTVTVTGTANVSTGLLHENYMQIFIQTDSAGLSLFSESFSESIETGDSVVATGVVQQYYGLTEINVKDYDVLKGSTGLTPPIDLGKVLENPDPYEGMLVAGEGRVVAKGTRFNGKYLTIARSDTSRESIMVYVSNFHTLFSEFDFESISIGDQVKVTGVLSQYDPDYPDESSHKIFLRTPEDFEVIGISRYQIILFGSLGLIISIVVVAWIVSLRTQVKSKTRELRESLEQKELLLKEIHHRVKNNLAIMSGLFEMQLEGDVSRETEKVLRDSQSRLRSMALVHDKLYQTSRWTDINIKNYVTELVKSLHHTFSSSDLDVQLEFDIEDIRLDIDQAIPCGLLINEVVVNAFKHAFKGMDSGTIRTSLKQLNGDIRLVISDNGRGIPEDLDLRKSDSLGMMLIDTFKEQLDADLEISGEDGTTFTLTFQKS